MNNMLLSKKVLHVAETALDMLELVDDHDQVDVLWIAAITSLRAVGHVLGKVDKANNPQLAPVIDQWWKEVNASKGSEKGELFHEFIDTERNATIKEFALHYSKESQILLAIQKSANEATVHEYNLDDLLFVPMVEGPYEGADIRETIAKAIDWWKQQFERMEL